MVKYLIMLALLSFFFEKIKEFANDFDVSTYQAVFISVITLVIISIIIAYRIIKLRTDPHQKDSSKRDADPKISAFGTIKRD